MIAAEMAAVTDRKVNMDSGGKRGGFQRVFWPAAVNSPLATRFRLN
jgi:hypothetical protein